MRCLTLLAALAAGVTTILAAQEPAGDSTAPKPYRTKLTGLPYATYTPQTKIQFGVAGGLQFKVPSARTDPGTRPSYLAANLAYTTKGQWLTFLENSLYTRQNRWWLWGRVSAGYFPLFYYGVGPYAERADTNLMKHRYLTLEGKALRRVRGAFSTGPHYRLESFFDVSWQFPSRIPAGLPGGTGGKSSGIGWSAQYDNRNSTTTPTRGRYLMLDYLHQAGWLGSDFDYDQFALDARTYLPVRHARDVIALQLYGEWNGAEVPIQSMARLSDFSSAFLARGVYLGRFRDRNEMIVQADYRGHLKGRFGYVVFGSAGSVYGTGGTEVFDKLKYTYGAGLRFNVNPDDPLNLRADFTLTSFGESGLSIGATEAF